MIFLAGNKADLQEESRAVQKEDGQKMAEEYNMPFQETSAKEGINVNETFQELVEKIDEVFSKLEIPKAEQKNILFNGKKKKSWC